MTNVEIIPSCTRMLKSCTWYYTWSIVKHPAHRVISYWYTRGLCRQPGRSPGAGSRNVQNVRSVVAKDVDHTKCQELRVLCTLRRRTRETAATVVLIRIFGHVISDTHTSRRPRWLGRLSSCLLKSISRVQFSPSAHTHRDFFLQKKMIAESARA